MCNFWSVVNEILDFLAGISSKFLAFLERVAGHVACLAQSIASGVFGFGGHVSSAVHRLPSGVFRVVSSGACTGSDMPGGVLGGFGGIGCGLGHIGFQVFTHVCLQLHCTHNSRHSFRFARVRLTS